MLNPQAKTISNANSVFLMSPSKNKVLRIEMKGVTSRSIRLNSSKHAQAPDVAMPLNSLAIAKMSNVSEQLKTTHCRPTAFAKSCSRINQNQ
jgi:hypothetical protein